MDDFNNNYNEQQNYAQPQQPYYQEPQQPYYQQAAPVQPVQDNTTKILVFGILSLVLGWIPGLIFGILARKNADAYVAAGGVLAGKAKVGRILGTVGMICGIVTTVLYTIWFIVICAGACASASYGSYSSYSYY